MTRLAALTACCFLLVSLGAHAQDLSVIYLEGSAQVRGSGASWNEIRIGDSVPLSAAIRLEARGLVQLKGGSADIVLTRPGTYLIKDVLAARRSMASDGTGSALSRAFRYLGSGTANQQSTVLGARGSEKREGDDDWVESSAEVFLEAGKEFIKAGHYSKAVENLEQALESATGKEIPEIHYYMACAYAQDGKLAEAWKQVDGLKPGGTDPWHGDFVLLKGKLLIDSSACAEAARWLINEGKELSQDAQKASLYFYLLALASRGIGDNAAERANLLKVVSAAGDSDLGKSASQLLQNR